MVVGDHHVGTRVKARWDLGDHVGVEGHRARAFLVGLQQETAIAQVSGITQQELRDR